MPLPDKFILRLAELKKGIHRYSYLIDRGFFDFFETSEIKEAGINFEIEVDKYDDHIVLHFFFTGTADFPCDRCSDIVAIPIQGREKIILKFGAPVTGSGSDDVLFIPVMQNDFNVSQYIYEFLNLAVPASRVHEDGKCNRDIIEKLKNLDPESGAGKHNSDPRWAALKNLKMNGKRQG